MTPIRAHACTAALVRLLTPVLLAASLALALPAHAQIAAPAPAPATEDTDRAQALEDLIVSLESETGREKLIGQLKTLLDAERKGVPLEDAPAAAEPEPVKIVDAVSVRAKELGEELLRSMSVLAQVPRVVAGASGEIADPAVRARWLRGLGVSATALLAALIATFIAMRLLRRPRRSVLASSTDNLAVRIMSALSLIVLGIVPLAVFWVTAEFVIGLLRPTPITLTIVRQVATAVVGVGTVIISARALLAPIRPRRRLIPLGNDGAKIAYRWTRHFAIVGAVGLFLIAATAALGLPATGERALQLILMLVLTGMAIALVLRLRIPVRTRIRGADKKRATLRGRVADIWHVPAIIYLLGIFVLWLLNPESGLTRAAIATAGTALAIVAATLIHVGARRMLLRFMQTDTQAEQPSLYLAVVHNAAPVVIWFAALLAILQAWGLGGLAWLVSAAGRDMLSAAAQITIVLVLSFFIYEVSNTAIQRYIERAAANGTASGRVRTLLPLLRNVIRVTVVLIAMLIVLSELGINIGPLLAGAGVVGLAIGFGSQKLVQDIINGAFIMIENTVSIGDVVSVAGHTGACENITIRTITLRDLSGTVFTIPFGNVEVVENLTKDFSYALIEAGVAYRENTDEVIEVLRQVADELAADPNYESLILEPLEVLGVDSLGDSAVVIKVRIKTIPIQQWTVKREFNRRMKMAFDARGIEIPFPHQTIYFGEAKGGGAPPAFVTLRDAAKSGDTKDVEAKALEMKDSRTKSPKATAPKEITGGPAGPE